MSEPRRIAYRIDITATPLDADSLRFHQDPRDADVPHAGLQFHLSEIVQTEYGLPRCEAQLADMRAQIIKALGVA